MQQPTYIIDFDSTIINCESLDELARLALAEQSDVVARMAELEAITMEGMAGTLPFDQSLGRRLKLFSATRRHIEQLTLQLEQAITPSFLRHAAWLEAYAHRIYVVSGGFEEYIKPIVRRLGLREAHVFANAFCFDELGAIIGFDEKRMLAKAGGKVYQTAALALPRPVIAIGDGYTDYEIRANGQADAFWAFCEHVNRPNVSMVADKLLVSFDEVVGASKIPASAVA